jgi:hypothetical protein
MRFTELATGCETARTPWATIGEDPSKFFDSSSLPEGFKFQDPSRMGLTIKDLLNHLRTRQESLGVNAFHFHHVLHNSKLEATAYPETAQKIIRGKMELGDINTADECMNTDTPPPHTIQAVSKSNIKMDLDLVQAMDIDMKTDQIQMIHPSFQMPSTSPWTFDSNSLPSNQHMQPPLSMPVPMFPGHFPSPWSQIPGSMPGSAAMAVSNPAPHADQHYSPLATYPFPFNHQHYMQHWGQLPPESKPANSSTGIDQCCPKSDPVFSHIESHLLPSGAPVFAHMPGPFNGTNPWSSQVPVRGSGVPSPIATSKSTAPSPTKRGATNQSPTKKTPKKLTKKDGTTPTSTPGRSSRTRKPTQKLLESQDIGI